MQIGKLGLFIIFLTIGLLILAALALGIPSFGEGLRAFGSNTLGPAIMGTLTAIFTTPLAWGAQTLLYAVVVWVTIALVSSLFWILILKRAWNKTKSKLGYGPSPTTPTVTSYPTMQGPQTVIVKEVPVSTTEKKETTA